MLSLSSLKHSGTLGPLYASLVVKLSQYCYINGFIILKNQSVFVKHYAPCGNKVQKTIFSFKVKVKVTRLLTLVSFERASLVEYACQIWRLYLLRFKSFIKG